MASIMFGSSIYFTLNIAQNQGQFIEDACSQFIEDASIIQFIKNL